MGWDVRNAGAGAHVGAVVQSVLDSVFTPDVVSQYVDDITDTLSEYFVCRDKSCLFVTCPALWVRRTHSGKNKRCPQCCREYRLWVTQRSPHWRPKAVVA